jgi:metal-sulfur cluster biosynthetic enzyme
MSTSERQADLLAQVYRALDDVLDPCSIGRGVPSGLPDMGLVVRAKVECESDGSTRLDLVLRMTAPACTFQLYFDQQVRTRLASIAELDIIDLDWSAEFDWSDDDMSDALKQRLRDKRSRLLALTPSGAAPS